MCDKKVFFFKFWWKTNFFDFPSKFGAKKISTENICDSESSRIVLWPLWIGYILNSHFAIRFSHAILCLFPFFEWSGKRLDDLSFWCQVLCDLWLEIEGKFLKFWPNFFFFRMLFKTVEKCIFNRFWGFFCPGSDPPRGPKVQFSPKSKNFWTKID